MRTKILRCSGNAKKYLNFAKRKAAQLEAARQELGLSEMSRLYTRGSARILVKVRDGTAFLTLIGGGAPISLTSAGGALHGIWEDGPALMPKTRPGTGFALYGGTPVRYWSRRFTRPGTAPEEAVPGEGNYQDYIIENHLTIARFCRVVAYFTWNTTGSWKTINNHQTGPLTPETFQRYYNVTAEYVSHPADGSYVTVRDRDADGNIGATYQIPISPSMSEQSEANPWGWIEAGDPLLDPGTEPTPYNPPGVGWQATYVGTGSYTPWRTPQPVCGEYSQPCGDNYYADNSIRVLSTDFGFDVTENHWYASCHYPDGSFGPPNGFTDWEWDVSAGCPLNNGSVPWTGTGYYTGGAGTAPPTYGGPTTVAGVRKQVYLDADAYCAAVNAANQAAALAANTAAHEAYRAKVVASATAIWQTIIDEMNERFKTPYTWQIKPQLGEHFPFIISYFKETQYGGQILTDLPIVTDSKWETETVLPYLEHQVTWDWEYDNDDFSQGTLTGQLNGPVYFPPRLLEFVAGSINGVNLTRVLAEAPEPELLGTWQPANRGVYNHDTWPPTVSVSATKKALVDPPYFSRSIAGQPPVWGFGYSTYYPGNDHMKLGWGNLTDGGGISGSPYWQSSPHPVRVIYNLTGVFTAAEMPNYNALVCLWGAITNATLWRAAYAQYETPTDQDLIDWRLESRDLTYNDLAFTQPPIGVV